MSLPITLRARHILPISGEAIEDGWLRIERGRIVAIGRRKPPGPVQDVGPAIILPGLINAHTHLEFSDLSAPLSGAGGLPAWIERIVALRRLRPDGQTEALRLESAIDAGLYESALAGVTGIGEIATALGPCAYRGKGGPRLRVYREAIGLSPAAIVRASSSLVRDCKHLSQGSVAAGISPHAPYSVAAPLGIQLISTSRTLGLPIAMHQAESREEAELLATGGGPLRSMLENLGAWPTLTPPTLLSAADWITLVAKAPRGLIVHGTFLGDDRRGAALARLSRHRDRLCVVVCPRTFVSLSKRGCSRGDRHRQSRIQSRSLGLGRMPPDCRCRTRQPNRGINHGHPQRRVGTHARASLGHPRAKSACRPSHLDADGAPSRSVPSSARPDHLCHGHAAQWKNYYAVKRSFGTVADLAGFFSGM